MISVDCGTDCVQRYMHLPVIIHPSINPSNDPNSNPNASNGPTPHTPVTAVIALVTPPGVIDLVTPTGACTVIDLVTPPPEPTDNSASLEVR